MPTKNACDTDELIFKFVHEFRTYSRKEKVIFIVNLHGYQQKLFVPP